MATLIKHLPGVLPAVVHTTTTYPDGTRTTCTLRLTRPPHVADPRYTLTATDATRTVHLGPMTVDQAMAAERAITLGAES